MKLFPAIITTLFISLSNLYAHSGTTDPNTPDEKYILYGQDFHCIFKVSGSCKDGKMYCGSAVVVGENWLITAAHVVRESKFCVVHKGDKAYLVDDIICHKDYDPQKFGTPDIAILHTEKEITLDFYPELYENDDEVDQLCSIAGYGTHGTFLTGANKFDENIRAGSNMIDKIENEYIVCTPSMTNRTALEFIISTGDSGGGLFIGNRLAGINSCVLSKSGRPDSSYGTESCHTRISKLAPWVQGIIQKKCKQPPF